MDERLLALDEAERNRILKHAVEAITGYLDSVDSLPVERIPSAEKLRDAVAAFDFCKPMPPGDALQRVAAAMTAMQTHTSNRRYFGLFNPHVTTMGIAGELLAAAFNPQLAAWTHAPFAVEAERHLIRSIGGRFNGHFSEGAFTSGGAEANLTALLCALVSRYPAFSEHGLRSLEKQPLVYASSAAHHSLVKAVRVLGLGSNALRTVPCDDSLGMDVGALREAITRDRTEGGEPFAVVATAGATATGVIERMAEIAQTAKRENLWFHVDAAWGGYAAFVPELASALAGIEEADSITFDPHKMLSVPMGTGMFLTRHGDALARAFSVCAGYMPASDDDERQDPFTHSLAWSRRFMGLKLLLSLAVAGWDGYADVLRRQTELGVRLRTLLAENGWRIVNRTPLPVVCFVPRTRSESPARIVEDVVGKGHVWISSTALPDGGAALRACITNFRTGEEDLQTLAAQLGSG